MNPDPAMMRSDPDPNIPDLKQFKNLGSGLVIRYRKKLTAN